MSLLTIAGTVFLPAILFGLLGWLVPQMLWPGLPTEKRNILGSSSNDIFFVACIPVLIFYVSLWVRASREDRQAIGALLAIFGVVVVFWAIFQLAGTALTKWTESYTNRTLPSALAPVVDKLGMNEEVDAEEKTRPKLDQQFRAVKDSSGKTIEEVAPDPYLKNLPKDEWPKSDEKMQLTSTEIFQSANPFFVVVLTPVVVGVFNWLKKRGAEPSTPGKIAWGLFIGAVSPLVMVGAVYASGNGEVKAAAAWVLGAYFVMTIGELCLSPMGLSLVSKLSPVRLTALMMGGWFVSTAIGNKVSGVLASTWDSYDNKVNFFVVNTGLMLIAAAAIFLMLPWLRRVVKEKTGSD
jgi:POT family proton-dependent oligopeptide transporter